MSALVIAVPAKGRLQENAEGFFTRAGLALAKPRGAKSAAGILTTSTASSALQVAVRLIDRSNPISPK